MKKAVALLLAILMIVTLFACNSTTTGTSPAASGTASSVPASSSALASSSAPASAPAAASASAAPASAAASPSGTFPGYFTDKVDHSARKTYTLCYAMPAETSMHDGFLAGFKQLEKKFNFKIVSSNANSNNDTYVQNLEIMAPKVDGFFVDSQFAIHGRVKDVMTDLKKPYLAFYEGLYDDNYKVVAPAVIQDGIQCGAVQAQWFKENYKKYWGDIDVTQVCVLDLISSTYKEFANRGKGCVDEFKKLFPKNTLYQEIDMTGQKMSADSGFNMVTPVITTQPNIKYWFIASAVDLWAQGVTRAVEAAKLDKNTIVVSNGNDVLYKEWDAGYDGCWKATSSYSSLSLTAPAVAGLVALVDGRAKPDTLWKELAKPGDPYGNANGIWYVDNVCVTKDNYKTHDADVAKQMGLS